MAIFKTVTLHTCPHRLWNLEKFLEKRTEGLSVLHVGAAGNIYHYLPEHKSLYFHNRLDRIAGDLVGIDIDQEGIEHAAKNGVEIIHADCQDMDLGRTFDVIIMLDVIEHLEHPGKALDCLMAHLKPGGQLIISTPNPTGLSLLLKALLGRHLKVYWDHVTAYLPENLQVLCERHHLTVAELRFFTHSNRWTHFSRLKSAIYRLAGWISPRTSNAFLVVIRREALQA